MLGGFALATLLLAIAGVYGVMSFSTSQRTREFGVRLALGATGRDIVGLVVREGLALAGLGVILGVALALPLTRVLRTLLFGVTNRSDDLRGRQPGAGRRRRGGLLRAGEPRAQGRSGTALRLD